MVSVVIPSRNEQFLYKTVNDVLQKATGEIEVIVVLEGYWPPTEEIINNPRVTYLHNPEPVGMRTAINSGVAISKGSHIMKLDAHCMVDEGFDEKLKADCQDHWIVVPRRKRLDAENWVISDTHKIDIDYEYLKHPSKTGLKGDIWNELSIKRSSKEFEIDDKMTFQGSCYFMSRKHWDWLGGLSNEGYGSFIREAQEIGLKTWLGHSEGRVVVNKKTWYAHLHKGTKYGRGYFLNKKETQKGNAYCDDFWFNNRWDKRIHNISWLIEKFWPVPTWTDEMMKELKDNEKLTPISTLNQKGIMPIKKYTSNYKHQRYSSHFIPLLRAIENTTGDILELGSGPFSTPLIHWKAFETGRKVWTYENDDNFYKQYSCFSSPYHEVVKVDDWSSIEIEKPWGLVFVDHAPAIRRKEEIKRLKQLAQVIVVHDTEGRNDRHYKYSEIYPLFKYIYQYPLVVPKTSYLSNLVDVTKGFK